MLSPPWLASTSQRPAEGFRTAPPWVTLDATWAGQDPAVRSLAIAIVEARNN